jgi:hypothetical protein
VFAVRPCSGDASRLLELVSVGDEEAHLVHLVNWHRNACGRKRPCSSIVPAGAGGARSNHTSTAGGGQSVVLVGVRYCVPGIVVSRALRLPVAGGAAKKTA